MFKYCKNCPIEKEERNKNSEICCMSSRQCCFTCIDEECPIKEEYNKEIQMFQFRIRTNLRFTHNFIRDIFLKFENIKEV